MMLKVSNDFDPISKFHISIKHTSENGSGSMQTELNEQKIVFIIWFLEKVMLS
jgi:hypothetical protein